MSFSSIYGAFHSPRSGKTYTIEDLTRYLRRFKTNQGLRCIGLLAAEKGFQPYRINNMFIDDSILAYLAMKLIERSNDHRKYIMTRKDLLLAYEMWFGVDFVEDAMSSKEFMRMFSYWQFDYQRIPRNLLPRTILLYGSLWEKTERAKGRNIKEDIKKCFDLEFDEIILFGNVFCGMGMKRGYVSNCQLEPGSSPLELTPFFSEEKQDIFFRNFSVNYNEFKTNERKLNADEQIMAMPESIRELVRFNPLKISPLIRPKISTQPSIWSTYLLPIPRLLYEAFTRGLYFRLAEYFRNVDGVNFTSIFGDVFEVYVGDLLMNASISGELFPEWEYTIKKSDTKKTTDWIMLNNGKATLIEVKSSSLYRIAKITGNESQVQSDISENLKKGAKKLLEFLNDIKSCKYPELERFSQIDEFECLLVCHDAPFFMNSDIRDQIIDLLMKDGIEIPKYFHWQIISIDDFEIIVDAFNNDIFGFLKSKNSDEKKTREEFRIYLYEYYREIKWENSYLDKVNNEFLKKIGLDRSKSTSTEKDKGVT